MTPIVDSQYLRSAGRDVEVPFRVRLKFNDQHAELTCSQVLRVLPEKRLVCFGEWDGRQVVAKFFMDPKSAKRHCAREKLGITALIDAGIKTPELLFKGMLPPEGMPVLVFQRIMPAQDLLTEWEQAGSSDLRAGLLGRAAAVIAEQHKAGLKQDDPHLKNFLWTKDDLFTIDGDAVNTRYIGKPLAIPESLENLGLFFAQFYPRFDGLVPKAFRLYAEKRTWPVDDDLSTRLLKNVFSQRNSRKKTYLKKIYRECSAFVCKRSWNRFMVCDRIFYNEAMVRFLADPDHVMNSGRVLKKGNTSTVTMVEVNGQNMVIKRYNIKNAWHAFKKSFRPSRAWISWRNAHLLASLGIATPKPIALVEKRLGPFRSTAYFVTEYVDGIDAYCLFHSDRITEINPESIVTRFGQLFQMLVDASISHGDSKATNYINANNELYITDLDAMREHRFKGRFRSAFGRDLARFMRNWADLPEIENMFREKIDKITKKL
ncbi:MAG: lipopolysaccharide kinase InaA family protein [Desulfobacterales bacterium]|nr:lipopolysaccharide kinase InaA family protein [Desulfobacterales bacterium]